MVFVRMWIVVSPHRQKRDGSSGVGRVEDGRGRPRAEMHTRISRVGPLKTTEVSQDGGTRYAQRAGEIVFGFG
ncbi:hypothetical protein DPMN_089059 [Dreissena polymorpha]|uniref:Uncharacterized protein n=1 Tax=Dreissena polymorpha TaxID=45954 RepID=A0A9D4KW82_DREPO|nr:hypothetical protein DPMN_089059 [Dreissena polymorpha]